MPQPQTILETERLALRELCAGDASFLVELLNQPSFHRYIGDRGVRTEEDALRYLAEGPGASYAAHGFGLWAMTPLDQQDRGSPIGICGLLKRDTLTDVDLGFALLPQYWRRGYTREAAAAVLEHARNELGLRRVVAITRADNTASIALLEGLGMHFVDEVTLGEDPQKLMLYATATPKENTT